MTTDADGRLQGRTHFYALRVQFEDTDLSGVVYHANYLRYMERARSDMLAAVGIDQRAAIEAGEGVYAIADVTLRFAAPARLGDRLTVESTLLSTTAATATIRQRVLRDGAVLTDGTVRAAFLTPAGRPRRQPDAWRAAFAAMLRDDDDHKEA